jgi:preprotein translocase subunit SecG
MIGTLVHYVVPVIHVLACLFLIVVVLLQTGKGADMGAVFGGGSQTLFGSSGAGNFLTKLTTATAIAFMVTSLILTYGQSRTAASNLIQKLPAPTAEAPPPVEQAPTAAAEGAAPAAQTEGAPPAAQAEGSEPLTAPVEAPPAGAPAGEPAPPP